MKKFISLVAAILFAATSFCQSYNSDLNDLGQYVQRMYMNEPFEGARVVENVDNCYLITVVAEKPGNNDYAYKSKGKGGRASCRNRCHIGHNGIDTRSQWYG